GTRRVAVRSRTLRLRRQPRRSWTYPTAHVISGVVSMISRGAPGPRRVHRSSTGRRLAVLATAAIAGYALMGASLASAANAGAIWTTQETCNDPAAQDANHYDVGQTVHIRGD